MNAQCSQSGKIVTGICLALLILVGFGYPALMLANKPANTAEAYTSGWQDGCQSGVAANAPLRALFSGQPFSRTLDDAKPKVAELYRNGWNEGFTVCRFNQAAWYGLAGFLLILLALACTRCRCGTGCNG